MFSGLKNEDIGEVYQVLLFERLPQMGSSNLVEIGEPLLLALLFPVSCLSSRPPTLQAAGITLCKGQAFLCMEQAYI